MKVWSKLLLQPGQTTEELATTSLLLPRKGCYDASPLFPLPLSSISFTPSLTHTLVYIYRFAPRNIYTHRSQSKLSLDFLESQWNPETDWVRLVDQKRKKRTETVPPSLFFFFFSATAPVCKDFRWSHWWPVRWKEKYIKIAFSKAVNT